MRNLAWIIRTLKRCLTSLRTADGRRGLAAGVLPLIEHDWLLGVYAWRTVVDVGANRGQFALAVTRLCPDAALHAFEPLPGPARTFRRVFRHADRVTLHPVAIGPRQDERLMYVSNRDDSSSLLPIGPEQVKLFKGTDMASTTSVTVRPLGDMVPPAAILSPALLKIDVQGAEYEVLKTIGDDLDRFDFVYVESSFREFYVGQALFDRVSQTMAEFGFDMVGIGPAQHVDGLIVQADILFRRRYSVIPSRWS